MSSPPPPAAPTQIQTSERQTAEAKSLFSKFQAAFNLTHTPYCQGEAGWSPPSFANFSPILANLPPPSHPLPKGDPWNNGSMALCLYPLALDIEGPFTSGQFAAFCPPATMEPVYRFFVQRRQDVSVLVHPNSGCETYDHSIWASWSGPVWPLNLDVFTCNSPGCVPPSW